jgi:lysophospholipase L1-like esterase
VNPSATRIGRLCAIVTSCLLAFGACLTSPAQAASRHQSAAVAGESLEGDWLSQATGTLYSFVQTGADSYSGRVPGVACVDQLGDIKDTAVGKGSYAGTENTWSSFDPCTIAGTATNTIQVSANGKTAHWDSAGCSDCGPQTWTRVAVRGRLAALGDSYSAGNGTPEASGDCDRSPQAWPDLLPGKVGSRAISAAVVLLACSGADSNGPETTPVEDLPAQIGQLRKAKPAPSLITVTIGGDDGRSEGVGFRNVLIACAASKAACAVAAATEYSWIAKHEPALLRQDFSAIKAADPIAILLAVAYPQIFPDKRCLSYSKAEVQVLNQLTIALDSAIARATAKVPGVEYVPAISAFSKHDLCSADPWVVSPLASNAHTGVHDWLHPNRAGQQAIAEVVADFIKAKL